MKDTVDETIGSSEMGDLIHFKEVAQPEVRRSQSFLHWVTEELYGNALKSHTKEIPRILWLSAILYCIIGSFWLLDSLKDTGLDTSRWPISPVFNCPRFYIINHPQRSFRHNGGSGAPADGQAFECLHNAYSCPLL